jgi:Asp-tRNA(Asn)/Glu-tRNA(Gln) amidotransferase A subunit family amidase
VPAELRPSGSVDPSELRATVWDGPSWPAPREDVAAVVRTAARTLEDRGIAVADEAPEMLERAGSLYSELRDTDRLQDVRRLVRGREDQVGEDVRAAMHAAESWERQNPRADPAMLWEERDRLRAALLAFLDRSPVLLMAVATVPAYDASGPPPAVQGRDQTMWDVLGPSRLISLFGVPAASVPFGMSDDGLPIGVQVVGRPFREDQVLAVARMLMEARSSRTEPTRSEVAG